MRRGVAGVLCLLAAVATVQAAAPDPPPVARGQWVRQTPAAAPADNPLKGLMPFRGVYPSFPHSMEWAYLPWTELQTGEDTFTWAPLDAVLDDISSRGHQAAFRIYADYPNTPSAIPAFLAAVPRRGYSDWGNGVDAASTAPDYDDPRMVRAMTRLIVALGARYDGDPRIGFITVGLIGFWGEWHTYRPSCNCDEWMPSRKTQRLVLDTFDRAFRRTKLLVRYADVGWDGDEGLAGGVGGGGVKTGPPPANLPAKRRQFPLPAWVPKPRHPPKRKWTSGYKVLTTSTLAY